MHYDEFIKKVQERARIRHPEAVKRAWAVMGVVQEAVSGGELDDIRGQLPDEYDELFEGKSKGPLSPSL